MTQDCPVPVVAPEPVFTQYAVLGTGLVGAEAGAVCPVMYTPCSVPEIWTTAQWLLRHVNRFWPPCFAIWTTVCFVLVHLQCSPGQRLPA